MVTEKKDPKKLAEIKKSDEEFAKLPLHLGEVTWRVALPILLLTIGGNKLDQRLNTLPIFSITGLLLSLVFATLLIYRYIKENFPGSFGGER